MANPTAQDLASNIRRTLHDLAQPLAAITGLVDLLLLEIDETNPKLNEVQMINEQLEKVLEFIGEIRQMARQASGGEPSRRGPAAHPEL